VATPPAAGRAPAPGAPGGAPSPVAPVAIAVANPAHWADVATAFERQTGVPLNVNVEYLEAFVATAVPALFLADATGQYGLLRGFMLDLVVAQCERNRGILEGASAQGVSLFVVGIPHDEPEPGVPIRLKLGISATSRTGLSKAVEQFWDVSVNQTATISLVKCPDCGAPLAPGELVCHYCHVSTAQVVVHPLLVSRLRLY